MIDPRIITLFTLFIMCGENYSDNLTSSLTNQILMLSIGYQYFIFQKRLRQSGFYTLTPVNEYNDFLMHKLATPANVLI